MNTTRDAGNSDWRDGFLFLGNHLTLDFLNTRPIQKSKPMELIPDFPALLRWFRAADLLSSRDASALQRQWRNSRQARKTVQVMQEFREKLRSEILAWERGGSIHASTIAELNRLMSEHPMLTELKASGKGFATRLYFAPQQPEDLLTPLAYSAAALFAELDRRRVRKCDNCVLHFHDISKKGTRRWCSMQMCGNRLKVKAYAARRRRQDR